LEIGLYSVLFSSITIVRHYSFLTYAYDLGIYSQALHNPVFNGHFFYNTADLLANPTGSLFGIHFSPIFFVTLPIYAAFPSPPTLLVIQSIALAIGALPLYLLASKRLASEKLGLTFATMYLLNPALQGINWYDFHPEAFLPPLILSSIYFYDFKKPQWYLASIILTLMCLEFASFLLIFMAFYFIIKMKPWKRDSIDHKWLKLAIVTILLSIVWLVASVQIMQAVNPLVRPLTGEALWGEIGAKSILDIPGQVVTHPERVIQALSFDGYQKLFYFLALLGFVAFLPVLEPLIVICLAPWLITSFISNFQPFYQFGDQYSAYILPFIFYGAVLGLERLRFLARDGFSKKKIRVTLVVLLCFSVILFFFYTPLNGRPYQSINWFSYGFPEISQHDSSVLKLLEQVPANASVLTQSDIFPHLSNRPNAYVFPSGVFYPPGESFVDVLTDMIDKVDFIVGDLTTDNVVLPTLLHFASINGSFGLYAATDGAAILKRGYSGTPVLLQPVRGTFNYNSFFLVDGSTVSDPESKSGYAFLHSTSNKIADLFWVGPYVFLLPGDYEATFRIKTDNNATELGLVDLYVSCFLYKITVNYLGTNTSGHHARFNVHTDGAQKVLASRTLNAADFDEPDRYQEFKVNYTVTDFGAYEFRGTALSNSSSVFLDQVNIIQIKPSMNLNLEVNEVFP
jgi:uncharacterized membrane protein